MTVPARLFLLLILFAANAGWAVDAGTPVNEIKKIELTFAERAYLAQKGAIKMCVQPDWLPYERINEKAEHEGFGADMIVLMQERLGIKIKLHPTKDWAASLAAIRARECDILSMSANIPSRRDAMDFSRPYIIQPLVIATQAREIFIENGSEIGERKIGIIKGYVFVAMLRNRYPGIQITEVKSAADGLERVRKDELWGYVDTMPTIAYALQKHSMLDLKISGKLDFTLDLCITSRNDEPLLAAIMQKAADSISDEERRAIINKWIAVRFEHGFDYGLFWKLGLGVALLLLGFYVWNRKLAKFNNAIKAKNKQIATLLDNSGQGFLSFGMSLHVDEGYSQECRRIFRRDALDLPLPELLCPRDAKQREFIAKTLRLAMESAAVPLRRDAYLGLLPAEFQLGERYYEAEYRLLDDGRMMLILTDITDEKQLKEKLALERTRLEFVVNALENRDDLLEMLRDFDTFRSRVLPDLLSFERQPRVLLAEVFRQIHTFKSLFAQASLPTIPAVLHELETRLARLRDLGDESGSNGIKRELGVTDLGAALEGDLALLREKLGDGFFNAEREIRVPASKLASLEAEAGILYGSDSRMLSLIRSLRYVPLQALIAPHFKAAEQLAQRQEKLLAPIACTGDAAPLDPEVYGPFCKVLAHLFRNAIDHGIEDADTRLMAGKEETATICCMVSTANGRLTLTIRDDGRGIDPALIRAKALELGQASADEAAMMSDAQALMLIFADGLTTRGEVSAISGRGMGLSAVQQELARLGGTVRVESTLGAGTRFEFTLPYQPSSATGGQATVYAHAEKFLAPLPGGVKTFCEEHLKLAVTLDETPREFTAATLLDFTALVSLGSGLGASIGLSVERPLLLEMTRRFEPGFPEDEIEELADSVGAEIINTLVGNATVYFTHLTRHVAMGTPEIIAPAERAARIGPRAFRGFVGHCSAGEFIVFCVLTEEKSA